MSASRAEKFAQCLRVLGHVERVRIVNLIAGRETPPTVKEISQLLSLKQPIVSQHLIKMRNAGILTNTRKETFSFYKLSSPVWGQISALSAKSNV